MFVCELQRLLAVLSKACGTQAAPGSLGACLAADLFSAVQTACQNEEATLPSTSTLAESSTTDSTKQHSMVAGDSSHPVAATMTTKLASPTSPPSSSIQGSNSSELSLQGSVLRSMATHSSIEESTTSSSSISSTDLADGRHSSSSSSSSIHKDDLVTATSPTNYSCTATPASRSAQTSCNGRQQPEHGGYSLQHQHSLYGCQCGLHWLSHMPPGQQCPHTSGSNAEWLSELPSLSSCAWLPSPQQQRQWSTDDQVLTGARDYVHSANRSQNSTSHQQLYMLEWTDCLQAKLRLADINAQPVQANQITCNVIEHYI
eukprot:jgi/Chrzof1/5373/Cz16g00140.t1